MGKIRRAALAAAVAALAACGGGGGGDASGLPPLGGGGFTLTPAALDFTYVQGGTGPGVQAMHAAWTAPDAYYLAVALPRGSSLPAWLPTPAVSGGGGSGTVTVGVSVGGLAPGTYTTSFMVGIARSDGTPLGYRDATVTLVVHPAPQPVPAGTQLLVGAEGVALTSTPGLSRLSRTLTVGTSRGGPAVAWTATASQGWLHVTAAGAAGDPLVLTANPAGLATDAVHEALVTVASGDPALSVTTQAVRVGLWVGADTPEAVTSVSVPYQELAVDPVRPYVYLVDWHDTITIRNVHTGASDGTIVVPGAILRSPTVSADGARLYALDTHGGRVAVVDLATRTVVRTWALPSWSIDRIAWTRTNGLAAIVTPEHVLAPATGALLGTLPWAGSTLSVLAVSRDGSRVCTADRGMSPYFTRCATLAGGVGALGPAVIVGPEQSRVNWSGFLYDMRLSPDGARLYQAERAFQVTALDATLAALGPVPFAGATTAQLGALAVDPEGRVYGGGQAYTATATLWSWGAAGDLLWSRDAGAIVRDLAVTGDGLRAVAVTGADMYVAQGLTFVTLP
jgi:hypothetical protein